MEYTIKTIHSCEKEISVRVPKELTQAVRDEYFEEIAKEVSLPGFRKGKVPREVLEVQFADKAKEEIQKRLISIAIRRISDQEKLHILAYPKVRDLKQAESQFEFKVEVELEPEIPLGTYTGIQVKRTPFEIKEEEVNETLEKIRETFANFVPINREAGLNDYLIADYEVLYPDKPKEEHKDEWIMLHEHNSLGDFSKQLVGVKSGEERNFQITISGEHPNAGLRGKQVEFHVKVKDVKEKRLPEINDDLARLAGEYKDLDALKQGVREDIRHRKQMEQEAQAEREILNYLVQNTPFETSRGVVERNLEKLVHDAMQKLAQRGFSKEQIEAQHGKLKEEFREEAERQVHLAFILDRIAEKENIRVTEADFKERFQELAQQYHMTLEKVTEHFQTRNDLEGLHNQILNEKVFRFIKEKAIIED